MSCCPTAPQIQTFEITPDEPYIGPEFRPLPGESDECYTKRLGNASSTGRVDDKIEPVPDKIKQNNVVTDCNAAVDIQFSVSAGSQPISEWVFTPPSFSGVTMSSSGKMVGTFDVSEHGKKLQVRVQAKNGQAIVDDRTYNFSPSKCEPGQFIKLLHPLPGSVVTSSFGPRRPPATGASSMHMALDFAYAGGVTKDVLCAADGEVILARPGRGYGNYIMVRHANAAGKHLCTTLYAHLASIYVGVGQMVTAGQSLGKEGNTGIGSGAHLHFEVRLPNGSKVDPTPFLKGGVNVANAINANNTPVEAAGSTTEADKNSAVTPPDVDAKSTC
jgi:hypothetical protein